MATLLNLGSFLLDGAPVKPGIRYQPGQTIRFADGNDLRWVVVNDMLIADRTLLVKISWNDLSQQGFVLGNTVSINGSKFLCRLLRVGPEEGAPNEWDAALDATSEDNELWHWKPIAFWGQDILPQSLRAYRGSVSARRWYSYRVDLRNAYLGFRPALTLLSSEHLALGTKICVLGGQSIIYGTLLETTGYDAIVRPDPTSIMADMDVGMRYAKLDNGTIAIDRTQMTVQTIKEN